jgi:hypothetical protein
VARAAKLSIAFLTLLSFCSVAVILFRPGLAHELALRAFHWRLEQKDASLANERAVVLPKVTFWAWERPEDLRFISEPNEGVAFLAKTLYLQPSRSIASEFHPQSVLVRPRLQPLRIAPGTILTAVVRIEASRGAPPDAFFKNAASRSRSSQSASENQPSPITNDPRTSSAVQRAAAEISDLQGIPSVRAIQIDFDATVSERPFYTALLSAVRRNLPVSMPLSITALASWCIGDPWLESLPAGTIDEAVPMLFRLGPDAADVITFLHSGKEFPVASCRASLGLSTDEPLSKALLNGSIPGASPGWRHKRIYVFSPRAQTQPAAQSFLEEWHP